MIQLFRNTSPGALTREQAVAREKERLTERRRRLAATGASPAAVGPSAGDHPGAAIPPDPSLPMEEIVVTGKPSRIPLQVFENQRSFLDALNDPVTRMAEKYGLNPENVLGLTAYESGWFKDAEARRKNNPFGVNDPGTDQLRTFNNLDDAYDYWGKIFGDQLRGIERTDEFIRALRNSLRAGPYNSKKKNYDTELLDAIDSVKVKRPLWQRGK